MTRPAVILSPHLDDAALSCWSVLTDQTPVTVVNVFAGVPPEECPMAWWDRMTGAESSHERALVRAVGRPEVIYAPAGIGGHPDHLVTRAAATALMRSGSSVTLYAELPYCMEY